MEVQLVSITEIGEVTTAQRDYSLKLPVGIYDKDNIIVARAMYVQYGLLAEALIGGPMYQVIESSKWAGLCTQDYNLSGVLGSGLGIVGSQLAAAAATVAGFGWCQTWGDNIVALKVLTAVVAGAPMVGASTDGYWDDIAGSFLTSDTTTAYNMGYFGVAGNYLIASASSLVNISAGGAWLCSRFA